jgi:hypothetical protein
MYPRDTAKRDAFLVKERVKIEKETEQIWEWIAPHGGRKTLLESGSIATIHREIMESRWAGFTAGRVLWWRFWLSQHTTSARVDRAITLIQQEKKQHGRTWGGPKRPTDIRKAWEFYRPAAHLWAVLGGRLVTPDAKGADPLAEILAADFPSQILNLKLFLELAETLRRAGIRESLLDPTETWRLPSDLRLSDATVFEDSSLQEWVTAVLEESRKPSRRRKRIYDEKVTKQIPKKREEIEKTIKMKVDKLPRSVWRNSQIVSVERAKIKEQEIESSLVSPDLATRRAAKILQKRKFTQ